MPPGMKTLKFDLTLMTGNLERNFKRCTVGLMKAWRDFGTNMKKSGSFLEAGDAIYMFGKKGVESITALFHPYEALVGKVVAVGVAVKKACENFEQFEKAGLKASNAFKSGGVVKDFDKFKGMIQNQTSGGMGNITDAMGALGSVRKANPALNSGEFLAIAELSTGAAAFNGEEYADAFERLGDILGSDAVSLDKLTSAGINFTFNEWQQVKAMNNRMMMHERNRIIIEKMKQTYKDAEKAEATTLSGMYRRIGNMLENLKVKLGEAIAPLAKPFFQLAVLIMNLAEGFVKPFVGIAKVIGAVFSPLTKLLTNCTGLVKTIGTLLGVICTVWLANWIKSQATILALTLKTALAQRAIKPVGIRSGISMLTGGKGIVGGLKSAGSFAMTGLMGAGGGIMKVLGLAAKGLGVLSKFAGPIGLVVTAITAVSSFFKGWAKGFTESFSNANGSSKSFMDILKQVGGIIMSIVNIILVPFKIIFGLFEKLGQMVGWLGGKIGAILLPIIEKTVGALEKANNAVADKAKEAYFWSMEKLGFDMSKQRAEYEEYKKNRDNPKADDKGFMPADIDFSSSFEGAASMTQRIQTALVSKNSPQAKMVDYLHDIRDSMKELNSAQNKQVEEEKKGNSLSEEQIKKLTGFNMGLA